MAAANDLATQGPLAGLVVVEMTIAIQGPGAGMFLGDMGQKSSRWSRQLAMPRVITGVLTTRLGRK